MAWYRATATNEGRSMLIGRKRAVVFICKKWFYKRLCGGCPQDGECYAGVVPKPFGENHGMIGCLAL